MWFVMDLRERMKDLRVRAGLSQDALAKTLGRPGAWVSRRETGQTAFKPTDVSEWAEACGFHADTVFLPLEAPAEQLLQALTALDPHATMVIAEAAEALPLMDAASRDLILAQLQVISGRFPRK